MSVCVCVLRSSPISEMKSQSQIAVDCHPSHIHAHTRTAVPKTAGCGDAGMLRGQAAGLQIQFVIILSPSAVHRCSTVAQKRFAKLFPKPLVGGGWGAKLGRKPLKRTFSTAEAQRAVVEAAACAT